MTFSINEVRCVSSHKRKKISTNINLYSGLNIYIKELCSNNAITRGC